jgi:hypothetical protein
MDGHEDDDIAGFNRAMDANRPGQPIRAAQVIPLRGETAAAPDRPKAAVWVDRDIWSETLIKPRPWIVPGYLMRRTVTVVAGPGGAGKSSLTAGWCVALALGQPMGGFAPNAPYTSLIYNIEDDQEEQRRRFSAALRPYGRPPAAVAERIIRCGPTGVGTLLDRDLGTGQIALTLAWQELEEVLRQCRPDVVFLDPLVELHTAEENDNTALRLVIAHLRELAQRFDCAIVLVHHTRKGATAGDVDSIRGAGSLVGAARCAFTVTPMTEDEAEEVGVPPSKRRSYVRVDDVKGNYSPAKDADWHELLQYDLDNGEGVAAMIPWNRPAAATGPALEVMEMIAAEVELGTSGGPYSPRLAVDQDRSLAPLFAKHGITSDRAQKGALKALMRQGFSVQKFRNGHRDERNGLRSPNGLPAAKWVDAQ